MKLNKCKIDEEIYYYYLKNGEKRYMYRHKYYDVLGKRKEKKKSGFLTEKEAYRSLLEIKAQLLDGNMNQINNSQMTVSELLDLWFETKKRNWKASTRENNKVVIDNHLKPFIGHYKLNKLTAATYERDLINKKLDEGFRPNSVHRYHTVFKTAINFAIAEEILQRNRYANVTIERKEKLNNFLAPDELNLFLDYAKRIGNPTEYTLTLLLTYSGARKGEALALKWSDIDFENNTVTIAATRDFFGIRPPKTMKSYRTIELDKKVMDQLAIYRKWCKELKFAWGMKSEKEDIIFISENGAEPVVEHYINRFFKRIYHKVSEDNMELKKITPHGLRHTHATILIDALVPPTDIADRLGNSLEMVYNVYAHSFKKANNKTVSAFSNGLSGAKSGAK